VTGIPAFFGRSASVSVSDCTSSSEMEEAELAASDEAELAASDAEADAAEVFTDCACDIALDPQSISTFGGIDAERAASEAEDDAAVLALPDSASDSALGSFEPTSASCSLSNPASLCKDSWDLGCDSANESDPTSASSKSLCPHCELGSVNAPAVEATSSTASDCELESALGSQSGPGDEQGSASTSLFAPAEKGEFGADEAEASGEASEADPAKFLQQFALNMICAI